MGSASKGVEEVEVGAVAACPRGMDIPSRARVESAKLCAIIRLFQVAEAVFGFSPRRMIKDLKTLRVSLHLVREEVADVNTPVSPGHVGRDLVAPGSLIRNALECRTETSVLSFRVLPMHVAKFRALRIGHAGSRRPGTS